MGGRFLFAPALALLIAPGLLRAERADATKPSASASAPTTRPPADNFQDDDFATRMTLATFKVFNRNSTATGFLVYPPASLKLPRGQVILVTANHVFDKMGGEQAILVLRKAQPDGSFIRRDFPFKVRDGKQPLWTRHPEQDVAVTAITLPNDCTARPLRFSQIADESAVKASGVHIGSDLLVLGFPERTEANGAGFPIARHASIASYPLWPIQATKSFKIDYDNFAGDSGGPVFLRDPRPAAGDQRPLVLGIVINQLRHDEDVKSLYEERMVHYPLDISTIVDAQFVRETIQQLAVKKKPTTRPTTVHSD